MMQDGMSKRLTSSGVSGDNARTGPVWGVKQLVESNNKKGPHTVNY
jgi:hypothetical protein